MDGQAPGIGQIPHNSVTLSLMTLPGDFSKRTNEKCLKSKASLFWVRLMVLLVNSVFLKQISHKFLFPLSFPYERWEVTVHINPAWHLLAP